MEENETLSVPAETPETPAPEQTAVPPEESPAPAETPAPAAADAGQPVREDFARFAREHPELEPGAIGAEVWRLVAGGLTLPEAYARREAETLRAENERLRAEKADRDREALNAARSTGARSAAAPSREGDLWDREWKNLMNR